MSTLFHTVPLNKYEVAITLFFFMPNIYSDYFHGPGKFKYIISQLTAQLFTWHSSLLWFAVAFFGLFFWYKTQEFHAFREFELKANTQYCKICNKIIKTADTKIYLNLELVLLFFLLKSNANSKHEMNTCSPFQSFSFKLWIPSSIC